jgi:hypothetical protein
MNTAKPCCESTPVESLAPTLVGTSVQPLSHLTTLEKLIAAIQDIAGLEEALVVPTVVYLLRTRRVVWHGHPIAEDDLI